MNDRCDACPVPAGADCLLRDRRQCGHAAREAEVRRRRPYAETPYTARALAHAGRANPFAGVDPFGRIRVAFVGPALSSHGGTETWHLTLLPRLDSARISLLGYGITNPDLAHPDAVRAMERTCPVPLGWEACRDLSRAADVVVYWGLDRAAALVGAHRGPVVVGVSHIDGGPPWDKDIFPDHGRIDRFAAVSSAALGPIPDSRRSDATVIPNAVDPARLEPGRSRAEIRAELGVPEGVPLLLYCGRLAEEKRPGLAADAAALIPDAVLAVAGDGYLRDAVESAMPPDRLRMLGVRSDVADLMLAADALLNPSECEGFGLTVAEALWLGCPVVGTPTGVLSDHPGMARTVPVDAGPEDWAAAIGADLLGPGRARADAATPEARRLFDPRRFADAWSDYLCSLAAPEASEAPREAARPPARRSLAVAREARGCPRRRPCGCNAVDCSLHGLVPASACLTCPDRPAAPPPATAASP